MQNTCKLQVKKDTTSVQMNSTGKISGVDPWVPFINGKHVCYGLKEFPKCNMAYMK